MGTARGHSGTLKIAVDTDPGGCGSPCSAGNILRNPERQLCLGNHAKCLKWTFKSRSVPRSLNLLLKPTFPGCIRSRCISSGHNRSPHIVIKQSISHTPGSHACVSKCEPSDRFYFERDRFCFESDRFCFKNPRHPLAAVACRSRLPYPSVVLSTHQNKRTARVAR